MSIPLVTVQNGNFQDAEGNAVVNGSVKFILSSPISNSGSYAYPSEVLQPLDNTGNLTQPFTLVPTSLLAGAYYTVKVYNSGGLLLWESPVNIPNSSPVDFNSLIPQF